MTTPLGQFPDIPSNDVTRSVNRTILLCQDQESASPIRFRNLRCTADGWIIANRRPNPTVIQSERTITASTSAQDLDFFGLFGGSRVHFHVFNDSVRGTLHLRFANTASLSAFAVKVPPQHGWSWPQSWGSITGKVSGIWDVADGTARTEEWF